MKRNITLLKVLLIISIFTLEIITVKAQSIPYPPDSPEYNLQKASMVGVKAVSPTVQQNNYVPISKTIKFQNQVFNVSKSNKSNPKTPGYTTKTQNCFIEPDGTYTSFPANDDGSIGPFTLPFNFDLYGNSYNQVYVNNNGNITFGLSEGSFSSTGFPWSGLPMIAPFWADIDTRGVGSALTQYKINSTNMIVTWNGVGYFGSHVDKLNEFQLIITNGNDPIIGSGNNVAFYYKNMAWTTGDASSGVGGFGGIPATAGVNKGDGVSYIQIGRFDHQGTDYDGPGGANDGVDFLDYNCFSWNVSSGSNFPPSVSGTPAGYEVNLTVGDAPYPLTLQFTGPEITQSVVTTINTGGMCNVTQSITNGLLSTANATITAALCNVGTHTITFTATDDYNPTAGVTTVNIVVNVNPGIIICSNPTDGGTIATDQNGCRPYNPSLITSTASLTGYTGTLEYKWQYSVYPFTSWIDIASNTDTYDPTSITQTTKYKRLVKVDCESSWLESNIVTITVNPQYIVTNTLNSGTGSLRYAIANTCNGDTIIFAPGINGQNINLSSAIVIDKNIKFDNCTHNSGISISGSGNNFIINAGKSITLLGCSKITVNGTIQNNAGVSGLVLNSGSSFINNKCNLAATAKRDLTGVWHLFGSPFVRNTGAMFANLIPPSGSAVMMPYTNGSNWGPQSSAPLFQFSPLVGYAVKPSAFITATLTGNLFCNPLAPTCDYTSSLVYNASIPAQSWNLLANPYTSYLNWSALGKTNVSATLYLWDNSMYPGFSPITNTTYMRTFNALNNVGVPSNTTPFIAPMQGFFAKAVYTNPKLSFPLSAQTHNTSTYYKEASNTEILVRLRTENEEGTDELVICKNENAKLDFETFDSEKLFSDLPVEIYSQANTGEKLVINSINTTNTIIPLGIKANAGTKAKITAFGLESGIQVYLEDRFKGKLISLNENTIYEFELTKNYVQDRFFIRFSNNINPLSISDIRIFENNNDLNIIAQIGENIQNVEVYSLAGVCVFKAVGNSNVLNANLNLSAGVYLVKVRTSVSTQNIKLNWK